ncbi:MAG: hypothetical protein JW814_04840 [Candidatus Krumholzibacteriota bacterium]|nr:hypothetical protein [Candidatus Krumholzibacteriota bacterium]
MNKTRRCAICGEETDSVDFLIDGVAVCDRHFEEAGRVKWQGIGFFRRGFIAGHREKILRENGIKSLLLKSLDPSGMILLVQAEEWEKAQKVIEKHLDSSFFCPVCNIEYKANEGFCPRCGTRGE